MRVVQNKEPPAFLTLFAGGMVILDGRCVWCVLRVCVCTVCVEVVVRNGSTCICEFVNISCSIVLQTLFASEVCIRSNVDILGLYDTFTLSLMLPCLPMFVCEFFRYFICIIVILITLLLCFRHTYIYRSETMSLKSPARPVRLFCVRGHMRFEACLVEIDPEVS